MAERFPGIRPRPPCGASWTRPPRRLPGHRHRHPPADPRRAAAPARSGAAAARGRAGLRLLLVAVPPRQHGAAHRLPARPPVRPAGPGPARHLRPRAAGHPRPGRALAHAGRPGLPRRLARLRRRRRRRRRARLDADQPAHPAPAAGPARACSSSASPPASTRCSRLCFTARPPRPRRPGPAHERAPFKKENKRTGVFTRRALLVGGGQLGVLGAARRQAVPGAGRRRGTLRHAGRKQPHQRPPDRPAARPHPGPLRHRRRRQPAELARPADRRADRPTSDGRWTASAASCRSPDHERARIERELRRRRRFIP